MSRRESGTGLLAGLARDLAELFPSGGRTGTILAVGTVLQVGYWYLGAPVPGTPRLPGPAAVSVLWSVLLLGLLPLALSRALRLDAEELGLGWGDRAAGRRVLAAGLVLVLPLGWLAAGDPAVRSTYPWAGPAVGASLPSFLGWVSTYSLYYISYEFFYRGFLLKGLEPALGRHGALWMQTVASTLLHLGKPLAEALAALPGGLLFGLIALRTRSLVYVTIVHLALGVSTDLFSLLRGGALG